MCDTQQFKLNNPQTIYTNKLFSGQKTLVLHTTKLIPCRHAQATLCVRGLQSSTQPNEDGEKTSHYLDVVENRGNVSRCGPVVRLRRQDSRLSEAVVDRNEGLHTVRGSRHVRHSGARHVLHREVRPRAVEQHHHFAVVG